MNNPSSFPGPKLNFPPNEVIPFDWSTLSVDVIATLTNSRESVPNGAAVVEKTTGSDDPPYMQLTDAAVLILTLSSETITFNFGSGIYTVSV